LGVGFGLGFLVFWFWFLAKTPKTQIPNPQSPIPNIFLEKYKS